MRPIRDTDAIAPNTLLIPNTPVDPLLAGETYIGEAIECYQWQTLIVSMIAGADGTLFVEFSVDGENWDSMPSVNVTADKSEGPHRFTIGRRFFRIRYVNNGMDQGYWRLQVIGGNHPILTSISNSTLRLDSDAILARTLPGDFEIS